MGGSALQSDIRAFCLPLSEDNIHSWIFIIFASQLPLQIQYPPTLSAPPSDRKTDSISFALHHTLICPSLSSLFSSCFVHTPICTSGPSIRNSVLAGFNTKEIAICRLWLQVRKLGHRFSYFLSFCFLSFLFSFKESLVFFFFFLTTDQQLCWAFVSIEFDIVSSGLNICLPSST